MAESTVGWFGVIEKYCSLADKTWLISQIRPNEQAEWLQGRVASKSYRGRPVADGVKT